MAGTQVPMDEGMHGFVAEPLVRMEDNEVVNVYVPRPVEEWCGCGRCQAWPKEDMNICCRNHPIWDTQRSGGPEISCITSCPNIGELMMYAPLRNMWHNYCTYHVPQRPDAELLQVGPNLTQEQITRLINEQKRLCAYRSLIFWAYPSLKRGERKPLPACIYAYVRALFPSTDDEEI
ncbi:uncharacterized protein [Watersipora subatra]